MRPRVHAFTGVYITASFEPHRYIAVCTRLRSSQHENARIRPVPGAHRRQHAPRIGADATEGTDAAASPAER